MIKYMNKFNDFLHKSSYTKIIIIGLIIAYISLCFDYIINNKNVEKVKPSTEYETLCNLEVISVDEKVIDYYENEYDFTPFINNITRTKTHVGVSTNDDDYNDVGYSIDIRDNNSDDKLQIRVSNDELFLTKYIADIRVDKNDVYAFINVIDNNNEIQSLLYTKNSDDLSFYNFSMMHDTIKKLSKFEKSMLYTVYNCRTKIKNTEVDDITIGSNKDSNMTFRLLVDSHTHQPVRFISSPEYPDDYTDLYYDKTNIDKIRINEDKLIEFDQNPIVELPDKNMGCDISGKDMSDTLDFVCELASYGNFRVNLINNSESED